jgi:hypothetical protein
MHDDIKRYELTGTVTSDTFLSTRERLIKDVEDSMRDEGFVPVLDLPPQFTRDYNAEDQTFTFKLSAYGVYVGEEAWQVAGLMYGNRIEKSTHPTK